MNRRNRLIALIAISMVLNSVATVYAAGITIPSGSTINVNTGTLKVPGNITIAGTLQTTTGAISLTGDWTRTGTFTARFANELANTNIVVQKGSWGTWF